MLRFSLALAFGATIASVPPKTPGSIDWAQVDRAMGKTGAMQPGDVYRYAFPRSDLTVTLDGIAIKPALALGGWVAFKATGDSVIMYMHIRAHGDPTHIASAIHAALALTKTPFTATAAAAGPTPPAMGVATGINIQPITDGKAVTTGDFVLTAAEVNPVIQALTENGIAVTAVHSHMLNEEPRLFFMHFWGNADAVTLARGLRAALDKTNSKGS